MDFRNLYMPLTAGSRNPTYTEKPPCGALAPFVRCYWYYEEIREDHDSLVIPDTCVDIIFSVGKEGCVDATFCGVNDRPYFSRVSNPSPEKRRFAARFYIWAFSVLCGETLLNTRNMFLQGEQFLGRYVNEMRKILDIGSRFDEFIRLSDSILSQQLNGRYQDDGFTDAVFQVLKNRGNIRINELAARCFISRRQLERKFRERMDLSPKEFAGLIRYQNTWRGILLSQDVKDIVFQLGYSDQSHLLREFRTYHGSTPAEAKAFALGMKQADPLTI
ncbi:MAG TPA: helix-turn-helix domain-containing protein [Clostridia bacterium]